MPKILVQVKKTVSKDGKPSYYYEEMQPVKQTLRAVNDDVAILGRLDAAYNAGIAVQLDVTIAAYKGDNGVGTTMRVSDVGGLPTTPTSIKTP